MKSDLMQATYPHKCPDSNQGQSKQLNIRNHNSKVLNPSWENELDEFSIKDNKIHFLYELNRNRNPHVPKKLVIWVIASKLLLEVWRGKSSRLIIEMWNGSSTLPFWISNSFQKENGLTFKSYWYINVNSVLRWRNFVC